EPFLAWALGLAGRSRRPQDAVFSLTWFPVEPDPGERRRARAALEAQGVSEGTHTFCYFGAFTDMVDMNTVIAAARLLEGRPDIKLVLCGLGDDTDRVRRESAGLHNVVMPGFVDNATMSVLMELSTGGLAPYRDRSDALKAVSNKVIQYWSGGLPVVS